MDRRRLLATLALTLASSSGGRGGVPPEFPFPVSLTSAVVAMGPVRHEREGVHPFDMRDVASASAGRCGRDACASSAPPTGIAPSWRRWSAR